MKITRLLGFLIMFLFIVPVATGGDIALFINIPSLIIVGGITLGGLFASGKCPCNLISINWGKRGVAELFRAAEVYRYAGKLGVASGIIGSLIGLILVLANMDDPALVGPALAIAILTTFYGVVIKYIMCDPIAEGLEDRALELDCSGEEESEGESA